MVWWNGILKYNHMGGNGSHESLEVSVFFSILVAVTGLASYWGVYWGYGLGSGIGNKHDFGWNMAQTVAQTYPKLEPSLIEQ